MACSYTHAHTHTCSHTHTHTLAHTHTDTHTHTHRHTHTLAHTHRHTHTLAHTHRHTHTLAHTHTHHRYPLLQWQARAAKRAAHRVSAVGVWLRERAALARYAHVPVSNLAGNTLVWAHANLMILHPFCALAFAKSQMSSCMHKHTPKSKALVWV